MENIKAIILNVQDRDFRNSTTGEITEMILITYGATYVDVDGVIQYAPIEGYCSRKNKSNLTRYIGKSCNLTVRKTPLKNGFKYSIVAIDNNKLV